MRATTATAVLLVRRMMLATTTITEMWVRRTLLATTATTELWVHRTLLTTTTNTERLVRRTRVQDCYRDLAHAWRRSCGVAGSTDVNNAAGSDVCRFRTLSS